MMLHRVLCLVAGYVFGLFQTGYFVGKHMDVDIRTKGSGNSGTTNALRVLGPKAGAVVFAGDVGKSVLLCLIVRAIYSKIMPDAAILMMLYGGFGVILGHNYPFYLNFKGGKGFAATGGLIIAMLDWRIFVFIISVFIVVVLLTRIVSAASMLAAICFPIAQLILGETQLIPIVLGVVLAAIVVIMHRGNIVRIFKGEEKKFTFGKAKG